jgi:hypothetical protein
VQKLVTICLIAHGSDHGKIEEHLTADLNAGWRIVSITGLGGGGSGGGAPFGAGWVAVVLERAET